jgi:hypothetical protein
MTLSEILIIGLLGGLVGLWFDGTAAREAGIAAVRKICRADGLQLLDETIALRSLKLQRNEDGRLRLYRIYEFEYSDTGDNRRCGSVHVLGHKPTVINIGIRPAPLHSPF